MLKCNKNHDNRLHRFLSGPHYVSLFCRCLHLLTYLGDNKLRKNSSSSSTNAIQFLSFKRVQRDQDENPDQFMHTKKFWTPFLLADEGCSITTETSSFLKQFLASNNSVSHIIQCYTKISITTETSSFLKQFLASNNSVSHIIQCNTKINLTKVRPLSLSLSLSLSLI